MGTADIAIFISVQVSAHYSLVFFSLHTFPAESVFRVQVNETEKLNMAGPADLAVGEDGLRLQSIPPGT